MAFLSRLPRLSNAALFLNGDEAVLGIMAQDFLMEGKFPLFFLGQSYGLSTIEVFFITPFVTFLGATDLAIKIPMLLLFSIGLVFMFRALQRKFSTNVAWLALVAMLVMPAWYLWSMQARGGYLTAFVLYNFLLFSWSGKLGGLRFAIVNYCSLSLLLLSQPLWLFALIPFVYWLGRARIKMAAAAFGLVVFTRVLLTLFISTGYWQAPAFKFTSFWVNLASYFELLPIAFSGGYWLGDTDYNLYLSLIGLFTLLSLLVWSLLKKQASRAPLLLLLGYLGISMLLFVLLNASGARYLLPIFQVLILFAIIHFNWSNGYARLGYFMLIGFCFILSSRLVSFRPFQYNQAYMDYEQTTIELVQALRTDGIKAFYCLDPLLQWQLMYYSEQELIGRWENETDRLAKLPPKVDAVYYKTPEKTALVGFLPFGYYPKLAQENPGKLRQLGDLFFIYESPRSEDLKNFGFTLNSPEHIP
jgi:hypothetical protein